MSTLSELRKSGEYTPKHMKATLYLDGIDYELEKVVPIYGEFDDKDRAQFRKADILINDSRFGAGVILVDGDSHKTHGAEKRDDKSDRYYRKMSLWVEHLSNSEVSREAVAAILARHERRTDDYGGAV